MLQLNPTFQPGGTIDDLVNDGTLHRECTKIFRVEKTDVWSVEEIVGLLG